MAVEVERKFLVIGTAWKTGAAGTLFRQGYLSTVKERTVRVRIEGARAVLTIKGITAGLSRLEFEYDIPAADAHLMLDELCERPLIDKTRHRIDGGGGLTWEVDEFHGENEGLVVAEIELPSADHAFARPSWLGREVSSDPRYFNANLVALPYRKWPAAGKGDPS